MQTRCIMEDMRGTVMIISIILIIIVIVIVIIITIILIKGRNNKAASMIGLKPP